MRPAAVCLGWQACGCTGAVHPSAAQPFGAWPLQDKVGYLRSQAEMELTSAQQRLEQVQGAAEEARRAFRLHWKEAAE